MEKQKAVESFGRLLDIMNQLREKCPWDREQTIESLRPLTIEETYELSDAILDNDGFNISKELGDLLLHIVFYAKIGSEKGWFDMSDVIDRICEKLIYRHPHVFSQREVSGTREVIQNWESLKSKEKDGNRSLLSGVPASLPSLIKAYRIQDKARAVGFDWEFREQVWNKVKEEIEEFEKELINESANPLADVESPGQAEGGYGGRAEEEFGDLLFSLVNAARLYNINPDTALEMTNRKFIKRFGFLEQRAKSVNRSLKEMSLEEMDSVWEEAKSHNDNNSWQERTHLLLGEKALGSLKNKTVAVIGLGGVGAYAAEMVARAGVGRMVIVDSDVVTPSNKNRQLLALDSTINTPKSKLMRMRLKDINTGLEIVEINEYLDSGNVSALLDSLRIDFIIDAIDTLSPKIALIKYSVTNNIPLVSSMGAGAKLDATKVTVRDISKSYNCPLAYVLRKKLRKEGISKGFKVVFSEELPDSSAIIEVEEKNKKSQVGTISYMPAVFGCIAAQVALGALLEGNQLTD